MRNTSKGILVYLLIAFGLAWIFWEIPIRMGISVRPGLVLLLPLQLLVTSILATPILWGEEFGWLRLRTGSIWSSSLAHSATNAIGGSLTALLFLGEPNGLFWGYLGVLSWIPLGALCAWIVLTGQLAPQPPAEQSGGALP